MTTLIDDPVEPVEEDSNVLIDEETEVELSYLYEELVARGELIVTIPLVQEQTLKKGLTNIKGKANQRMKDAGMKVDALVLKFLSVSPNKANPAEDIDVHIILEKRAGITIKRMEVPSSEL